MGKETKLKVGEGSPDFTLPATGEFGEVTLSSFRGKKNVVLAFFPAAFSPVCGKQIPAFQKDLKKFEALDTQILAISVDNTFALKGWEKNLGGLSYPLLSDFNKEVARAYGVLREEGFSERAIFVIDKEGVIRHIKIYPIEEVPNSAAVCQVLGSL